MSDEANFDLNGIVNKQNFRYWSDENYYRNRYKKICLEWFNDALQQQQDGVPAHIVHAGFTTNDRMMIYFAIGRCVLVLKIPGTWQHLIFFFGEICWLTFLPVSQEQQMN